MSTHTPGPWAVDDRRAKGGCLQVQAQHRGPGSSYCVAEVNFYEQPLENASLIAAAPDLLAALEVMTDIVWQYSQSMTGDGYVDELAQARAAITKAKEQA